MSRLGEEHQITTAQNKQIPNQVAHCPDVKGAVKHIAKTKVAHQPTNDRYGFMLIRLSNQTDKAGCSL
jgi:hypothetical protein